MSTKYAKALTLLLFTIYTVSANAMHPVLTDEQFQASMCILANQGVYLSATERQSGTPKDEAKALMKKELEALSKQFTNKTFTNAIGTVWHRILEGVYEMPIQPTVQDKEAFISDITQQSFLSCMNAVSVDR